MKLLRSIYKSCYLNLLYPEACQHCQKQLDESQKTLCKECFESLNFTKVKEHCKRCFEPIEERGSHPFCERCFQTPSPFYRALFPLESIDAAVTLHSKLKQFSTAFVGKGLAGLIVLYFLEEELPFPDLIIPMPDPLLKKMLQGQGASCAIAKALSEILSVPYVNGLSASGYGSSDQFLLKKSVLIENKKVLLVGSIRSQKFFKAGEALIEGSPSLIMGAGIFT